MKRNNKRQPFNVNDDDPAYSLQANLSYAIPKEAVINGLFAGAKFDSIYSSVKKYSLCVQSSIIACTT